LINMPYLRWRTCILSVVICFTAIGFSIHRGVLLYTLLTLSALLIHEFSHILCTELLGYPVQQFSLNPLGGCLKVDPSFAVNPQAELLIAAAGPFANLFMVGGVLYLRLLGINNIYLAYWLQINMAIGLINLIPAAPLDGGRILHAWLNKNFGLKNSYLIIKKITIIIGSLFLILGICRLYQRQTGMYYVLIAAFILLQIFSFKNPRLNLILKTLQHKRNRLAKKGFLRVRPVLVESAAMVRLPLQYYGATDYIIFFIRGKDEKMSIISEESAWNTLINQGYNVTFDMVGKVPANICCRISSDEVE
jgi:stage IV sporulation protein FB